MLLLVRSDKNHSILHIFGEKKNPVGVT